MDPMNAVQEVLSPFLSTSKQKTKQTQTTELAQGAAPNKNKKTQQQSWPTRPPQTTKKHNSRAGPQGRSKQKTTKTQASELAHRAALNKKKETQQQSWSTRPPQSIIIVIVVVVAVEIVIILVIDSTNKRTSNNNE